MATVVKSRQSITPVRRSGAIGEGLTGVYTLWLKHMQKFFSSSMEIGGTLFIPVLWMFLFGVCMEGVVSGSNQFNYQAFITPGVMLLTGLSAAILGGATMLMDRINGVVKEYLVAPIPRLSILLGTLSSGLTKALFQAIIVIWLGFFLDAGLRFNPPALLAGLGLTALYSLGFVGVAAGIACRAKSMDSYHSVIMLLNLPVLFLSNTLYPLSNIPEFLRNITLMNPTTYAVDAIRFFFYGFPPEIGILIDIPVLLAFTGFGLWFGYSSFKQAMDKIAG